MPLPRPHLPLGEQRALVSKQPWTQLLLWLQVLKTSWTCNHPPVPSLLHQLLPQLLMRWVSSQYNRTIDSKLPKGTPGSDKAEVAKRPPGLTHSEEEWLKKSSGPGKVRFVPLSLPGGRVLQHLVCGSMSIEPIFLDSNGRVYFSYSSPQKTEKHSYDTEFTECLESNGVQSRGGCLQSENQPQQAVSKSGLILTLASWREDLEKACRQRPGTHQHASKVNFAFFLWPQVS